MKIVVTGHAEIQFVQASIHCDDHKRICMYLTPGFARDGYDYTLPQRGGRVVLATQTRRSAALLASHAERVETEVAARSGPSWDAVRGYCEGAGLHLATDD